jgi:FMN phosphatase YigB (HAD superfamily)
MKVIFLDIDGVLLPAGESVRLLNDLIKQTGAKIVVSSCRRIRRDLAELRELLLAWGVEGVVLDKTPHLPESERGVEIQRWLDERKEKEGDVEAFVILDDCGDMPTLLEFLVQTEFETGLTKNDAEKALRILSHQP